MSHVEAMHTDCRMGGVESMVTFVVTLLPRTLLLTA
jgi:hypothetical protein